MDFLQNGLNFFLLKLPVFAPDSSLSCLQKWVATITIIWLASHIIYLCCITGSAVECLLEAGASSNVKDVVFEETPLHKAVNGQLHDNVRHLVNYGADTNASDHQGETPLHKAATTCRHLTIWFCLLAHGADPALTCKSGVTAMDLAMKTKNNVGVAAIRQYTSGNTKRIVKIPWQMYQESER